MRIRLSSHKAIIAAAGLVIGLCSVSIPLSALGSGASSTFSDGMPSQGTLDLTASATGMNSGSGNWGDWSSGVSNRPFVTSLSLINNGVTTPVITSGTVTSSEAAAASGSVAAVVSPVNLCRIGQTAASGVCYATPNRVGVTIGYSQSSGAVSVGTPPMGYNFAAPSVNLVQTVNANTIIDMTIALNSFGPDLRWSWVNGDLLYWQVASPGTTNATVHLQFRLANAPAIYGQTGWYGCTATPITSCTVNAATADILTGSVFFSLDSTLASSLTGAVFATQHAIFGYLQPGGTTAAPTVDIQASSSHFMSDGVTPESGVLEAFLPASTLLNLYNLLPSDAASILSVTRSGDAGSNGTPTDTVWCSAACPTTTVGTANAGSDGLFITIPGISFSVPMYVVRGSTPAVTVNTSVRKGHTTFKARIAACRRANKCLVSLYDLGTRSVPAYDATATAVIHNRSLNRQALSLAVRTTKLRKGHRFLLEVHSLKLKKVLASTVGTVR